MTFNCNGINNHRKLKDVFYYLRQQKADIIFSQEAHSKFEAERFIRPGGAFDCFPSGVETNKNGVAILFNNIFECKVLNTVRDANVCFILMDVEIIKKKHHMTLVNVYVPTNAGKPDFFLYI